MVDNPTHNGDDSKHKIAYPIPLGIKLILFKLILFVSLYYIRTKKFKNM